MFECGMMAEAHFESDGFDPGLCFFWFPLIRKRLTVKN
jgi:hypothetical protein